MTVGSRPCLVLACVLAASGCISADVVECGGGVVCPSGTSCRTLTNPDELVCASKDQLAACDGKATLDACDAAQTGADRCYDGVCLQAGCGNRRVDPGEQCDDGNSLANDGCSIDCTSDETCGNAVTDLDTETCDDGNFVDHDGCTSRCQREQLAWVERFALAPPREYGAMAYDPLRQRVVVFGGQPTAGTWEWDGAGWQRFEGVNPPGREGTAMAFDGRQVLLYGGIGAVNNDTWTFDGATWTQRAVSGPGDRNAHSLAFDSRRGRVVLFGGSIDPADEASTWEWDGSTWQKKVTATSPPPRFGAAMAYDPKRGVVVLTGGHTGSAQVLLSDTWTYDGTNWTLMPQGATVPARAYARLVVEPTSDRLFLIGGCESNGCITPSTTTILAWNGTQWTTLTPSPAPDARSVFTATTAGDRIVVAGGFSSTGEPLGDVWIYDGGQWSQPETPGPRTGGPMVLEPSVRRLVLFGGQDAALGYPTDTWELSERGWKRFSVSAPDPSRLAGIVYDPADDGVMLLANPAAGTEMETWLWRNQSWTKLAPSTGLPNRFGPRLGVVGGHVFVVGTAGPMPLQREVWRWDANTWTHLADIPTGVQVGAVGTDPVRDQLVIYGGAHTTWTFDGTAFTLHDVASPPTGADLVWNAPRQRVWLASATAAWEWDGSAWSLLQAAPLSPPPFFALVESTFDGAGVVLHGASRDPNTAAPYGEELWELRWRGPTPAELCDGRDIDGDNLNRCADGDCWWRCSPHCPPGTSCPAGAPACGDGVCSPDGETCRSCPADCTCTPLCGDFVCDAGETGCPGDCP